MKSLNAINITTVFETDVYNATRKVERAKLWGKLLCIFTFGLKNNDQRINQADNYLLVCKDQRLRYNLLLEKAKSLDDQLLQYDEIEGARVSKNTFSDFPVLGAEGYPPDWENLREIILTRDNYQCQESETTCTGPLQIHHIIPLSKGGTNKSKNLITLCMYHHCQKHEHMRMKYENLRL
jgi:hypothetical protein